MKTKYCPRCRLTKNHTEFSSDKRRKDGLVTYCIECSRELRAIYYKENREKINKRSTDWIAANKERYLKNKKIWYENNKDRVYENCKKWRALNRDKPCEYDRKWRNANKEKRNIAVYKWAKNNHDRVLISNRRSSAKRRSTPSGLLNNRISILIYKALKGNKNGRSWESLVGYTLIDFKDHIESLFQAGMTWENMGQWHIDHVKPKSLFNYNVPEDNEFKECWSLENLQPLWAKDNLKKGSKFNGINHIYYESNSMS